jgi:hypothetical protein
MVRSPSWLLQTMQRWLFLECDGDRHQQLLHLTSQSTRRNYAAQDSRMQPLHIRQTWCKPFHSSCGYHLLHSRICERSRRPCWTSRHTRGGPLSSAVTLLPATSRRTKKSTVLEAIILFLSFDRSCAEQFVILLQIRIVRHSRFFVITIGGVWRV